MPGSRSSSASALSLPALLSPVFSIERKNLWKRKKCLLRSTCVLRCVIHRLPKSSVRGSVLFFYLFFQVRGLLQVSLGTQQSQWKSVKLSLKSAVIGINACVSLVQLCHMIPQQKCLGCELYMQFYSHAVLTTSTLNKLSFIYKKQN